MSSYATAAAPPSKQASLDLPDAEDYGISIDNDGNDSKTASSDELISTSYILGTLIVRVIAARKLLLGNPNKKQRRVSNHSNINPYASLRFNGQSQRTTECYSTSDPIWPREETMFLDVSLPLQLVTYSKAQNEPKSPSESNDTQVLEVEEPMLTIALFHNNSDYGSTMKKGKGKKGKQEQIDGDSDEPFLGMASINVRQLLTGKQHQLDEWLELSGGGTGAVRLLVEYEASDPPPRPGDMVRLTRFCSSRDLYPINHMISYQVTSTDDMLVTLSSTSPEGWISTFRVHRHMLICEERHQGAIEFCHDELALVKLRFAHSPMVHTLGETLQRVPEEGLFQVSVGAIQGGVDLVGRWWQGGLDTAVGDFLHATNWDGRHIPRLDDEVESDDDEFDSKPAYKPIVKQQDEEEEFEPLPGMPCCPITGEPMRNPVVAGDGHTYERAAIARWLQSSDKSPLTGSLLPHKELVPNYVLMSSLEEASKNQVAKDIVMASMHASKSTASEYNDDDDNDDEKKSTPRIVADEIDQKWKPVGDAGNETADDIGSEFIGGEDVWMSTSIDVHETANDEGSKTVVASVIDGQDEGS